MVEAAVFGSLPAGRPAATVGGLYDRLVAASDNGRREPVRAHRVTDEFLDVGTPADYLSASLAVARREGRESSPVGAGSTIDSTAALTRTVVWDDVAVGAGCRVDECILADGVTLPPGAMLRRRICVPATCVGDGKGEPDIGNAVVHPLDGLPVSAR